MNKVSAFFFGAAFGVFLMSMLLLLVDFEGQAYRRGQIDALTGKVKYHLVTKPDSTRVWEKIGGN